jgi:D-alanyl-D-alanine carboxypeptidase/D-alanyl-D-alanine-endopeptidase (penicillin-binding protein 4)
MRTIAQLPFVFAVAWGCRTAGLYATPSPVPRAVTRLRAAIDSMVGQPEFSNANWGILIVDPASGDTLYSRNAGKLFMPASNMKILTTSTALTQLGPTYQYNTVFAARGTVADSTLTGDLLVIGRGDPSVSDHMRHDAMAPLDSIADSLHARGIARITGRVLAWGDAFPGEHYGYGWTYDDFDDDYSAPIDELLFNEGFSELHVHGGAQPGDSVRVDVWPAHTVPRVRVLATTVAAASAPGPRDPNALRTHKDSVSWEEIVDGQIAAGDSAVLIVTHHDPDQAYLAAFREALASRGITVAGGATDTVARIDTLATLTSPPLSDILKALLKPSQNQLAEMLFRTVALQATGIGRADSARAVIERQIAQWGVPVPLEAVVRDGSGLARYDYVSPQTLVRILDVMRRAPTFQVFYDALPIAGIDGTLDSRMKGTPAEGNVHAKTGSVALARSLSGYVTTADGRMLIFSFLANNWTTPTREVEHVQDAILVRVAGMRLH